jgi:hypothetical protein
MTQYAAKTNVPTAKTKGEIEAIVERYGASQFASGWDETAAKIGFRMAGRQIAFLLEMPNRTDPKFTQYVSRGSTKWRTSDAAQREWEQACRQRWRALLLVIKAKLEAVETGISTLENEFLANIVLPDGRLVGQWMKPQLEASYGNGNMPPLLSDFSA